jgi:hypothetical protein
MSLKTLLFSTRSGNLAPAMGLALGGLLLAGCSDDQQMAAQYVERPIEQIYAAGWTLINRMRAGNSTRSNVSIPIRSGRGARF